MPPCPATMASSSPPQATPTSTPTSRSNTEVDGAPGITNLQQEEHEIPIIDLSNVNTPQLLTQLYKACSTWGFFQLINHNIPSSLLHSFQNEMSNFFALPYATKSKLKRNANNARGYFDDELTKRKRDWKEALDVGVPGSRDWTLEDVDVRNGCLDGYNQFPMESDCCLDFRSVVVEYFEECSRLSGRLAELMILALNHHGNDNDDNGGKEESNLDEEEGEFLERIKKYHTSYLRMNYYPPSKGSDENINNDGENERATRNENLHNNSFSNIKSAAADTLGISPHRDAGFLTILLQDNDCHSLQVARFEDDDHIGDDDPEKWVTVHPVPGALTINTGDMAMICSNGRFRAPLHRVRTDPTRKRYSAPFFYNPGYTELISPFASCCKEKENEKSRCTTADIMKFNPCQWGYFRGFRFAGDLTDLGVEIQTSHFKVVGSNSNHIEKQKKFMEVVDYEKRFDVEKYRHIIAD